MADFNIKQNDRIPAFQATLLDGYGNPVNLTGATVVFNMKSSAGVAKITAGTCSIVTATAGIVSYAWAPGDTNTVDTFSAEFEVTFPSGLNASFPNDSNLQVVVYGEVG